MHNKSVAAKSHYAFKSNFWGSPQYQPSQEIQFWGTVAAVLIVGGTLAEDVITGGGGIADDAASFYLAYRLTFGL